MNTNAVKTKRAQMRKRVQMRKRRDKFRKIVNNTITYGILFIMVCMFIKFAYTVLVVDARDYEEHNKRFQEQNIEDYMNSQQYIDALIESIEN